MTARTQPARKALPLGEVRASSKTEKAIRTDERKRIAKVIRDNKDTLTSYVTDKDALIYLIALMLEMNP